MRTAEFIKWYEAAGNCSLSPAFNGPISVILQVLSMLLET